MESINIETVTSKSQISSGDLLIIKDKRGNIFPMKVKEVLNPGSNYEEILLSKGKNLYFILSMYLEGKSWVEYCKIVKGGEIFSISNNMNAYNY